MEYIIAIALASCISVIGFFSFFGFESLVWCFLAVVHYGALVEMNPKIITILIIIDFVLIYFYYNAVFKTWSFLQ